MRWLGYAAAFAAGAVVGGLVVRELAIRKIEGQVGALSDGLFGKDSYASGATKTIVDMFARN